VQEIIRFSTAHARLNARTSNACYMKAIIQPIKVARSTITYKKDISPYERRK